VKINGQWHFQNRTLNLLAVDNSPTVYETSPTRL
jgi:hypothetical protein